GILALIPLIAGAFILNMMFRAPEEASTPIEAISIDEGSGQTINVGTLSENSEGAIFAIMQDSSEARFSVEEVLRGDDKAVVGVTDQVAGELALNFENPAATQMGPILINARTLVTDNEFRNRAIKNRILYTDQHEFVTFTPKQLVGLPDSIVVGEVYDFQIIGDLEIMEETQEVTFDISVTVASETEISGFAIANVSCETFNITIPAARSVDMVEDEVTLQLEFVSVAQG
ncbi:MAG: YceI family protein, partial [Chloroflexi bacterium]|nr:YceI family protein [Chloroflexota bacterium]